MLTPDLLHDYQKRAVNFQCSSPTTMLWWTRWTLATSS